MKYESLYRAILEREDIRSLVKDLASPRPHVKSSDDAYVHLRPITWSKEQERLSVLALDKAGNVVDCQMITAGGVARAYIDCAQIFRWVLTRDRPASGFVVAHNHPSGNKDPSQEDVDITSDISRVAEVLGVPLLDHLIITDSGYTSIKEWLDDNMAEEE